MKIILASNSPRRREILSQIGISFDVIPSEFEEKSLEMPPEELVTYFSHMKAKDVCDRLALLGKDTAEDRLVIGSDTIVYLDRIMGKPRDGQDAFQMLRALSGKEHYVMSGISVIRTSTGENITEYEKTKVRIKKLTDSEIWSYINTGEPMDKAGAYAIQGLGSLFVQGIEGCYFNVVGLPVFRLSQILKRFDMELL